MDPTIPAAAAEPTPVPSLPVLRIRRLPLRTTRRGGLEWRPPRLLALARQAPASRLAIAFGAGLLVQAALAGLRSAGRSTRPAAPATRVHPPGGLDDHEVAAVIETIVVRTTYILRRG